ncbi:MAG: anti-sigma factor family protein [bacterium]
MRCDEVRRLLSAYYDKELPPEKIEAIREHLSYCTSCNKNLESIKKIHSLMDYFPILEVGPYFETQIFQRIEEEKRKKKRFSLGFKLALGFGIGLLVFFTMNNIWNSSSDISNPSLNTYVKEYVDFTGTHISRNNPGLAITVSNALGDYIK